jgi:pilus assembly protein CpaF
MFGRRGSGDNDKNFQAHSPSSTEEGQSYNGQSLPHYPQTPSYAESNPQIAQDFPDLPSSDYRNAPFSFEGSLSSEGGSQIPAVLSPSPQNADHLQKEAMSGKPGHSAMDSPDLEKHNPNQLHNYNYDSGQKNHSQKLSTEKVNVSTKPKREDYYDIKSEIFAALIDAIDLAQMTTLDTEAAKEEIRDVVNEIIALKSFVMSISEQEHLLEDICNDVLGYGPLEPLLARDDIADIMVNGAGTTYIEVGGKVQMTDVSFRDNQQLMNVCQRIVSQVGRRVDESSPICDARLLDGSRVNVIAPPLAIDGPALTIRKFKKDKLTLDQLVKFGSITPEGAKILQIIGKSRCNVVVSGGTGSGKTTLLNCLTAYIEPDERIITCEDSAELQLQQPHVVRLETRPPNLEGEGEITMRDLVKNCLRMRPERIIVGEVRGPEAFDLLQAMNTGHDGSMGTLHANSPRECLSRIESMITMGGFSLPSRTIKEMICTSVDVIVQAARLRDGSRRITHITEVIGMEGDVIVTQDLVLYDIFGEDANGKIIGRHRSTGVGRPKFWERARYYNQENNLAAALDAMAVDDEAVA